MRSERYVNKNLGKSLNRNVVANSVEIVGVREIKIGGFFGEVKKCFRPFVFEGV